MKNRHIKVKLKNIVKPKVCQTFWLKINNSLKCVDLKLKKLKTHNMRSNFEEATRNLISKLYFFLDFSDTQINHHFYSADMKV